MSYELCATVPVNNIAFFPTDISLSKSTNVFALPLFTTITLVLSKKPLSLVNWEVFVGIVGISSLVINPLSLVSSLTALGIVIPSTLAFISLILPTIVLFVVVSVLSFLVW